MSYQHIMLYSVASYEYMNDGTDCVECCKVPNHSLEVTVRFDYYDYIARKGIEFRMVMCRECFKEKIKDKSTSDLFNYVPLLKVKERTLVKHTLKFNPFEENPYSSLFDGVWEYVLTVPKEEEEVFTKRAKEYNE